MSTHTQVSKGTQHTPGPWAVMADPDNKGKHPFHDHRWIVTEGTEAVFGHDPRSWAVEGGSLVCCMRDGPTGNARLIAAAPDMLAALRSLLENAENMVKYIDVLKGAEKFDADGNALAYDSPEMAAARQVVSKAEGKA